MTALFISHKGNMAIKLMECKSVTHAEIKAEFLSSGYPKDIWVEVWTDKAECYSTWECGKKF